MVRYEPATGQMFLRRGGQETPVERVPSQRYLRVSLCGVHFYAHRIAWKLVHGTDPVGEIDHVDLDKTNNRISNLRVATHAQNGANQAARGEFPKGVFFDKSAGRYRARIRVHGARRVLGSFETAAQAGEAYRAAAVAAYGEFARFSGRMVPQPCQQQQCSPNIPPFPVPDFDRPTQVFGARRGAYLTEAQMGSEFYRGTHPMCRVASTLFFKGGSLADHGLRFKSEIDKAQAMGAIQGLLCSFEPSHEIKIGTVGVALANWCEPVAAEKAA